MNADPGDAPAGLPPVEESFSSLISVKVAEGEEEDEAPPPEISYNFNSLKWILGKIIFGPFSPFT